MRKKLIEAFSGCTSLPIEVSEVTDALIEMGHQDNYILDPRETDPGEICGIFYQYTTRPGVYAPPDLVTLIVYSENLPVEWQRLVCCKEIVHACDSHVEKTDTEEEVEGLLEKLLGPLSTEDYGLADFMATVDRLALYQAVGILFPLAAREEAKAEIENGTKNFEQIVEWVCLPPSIVAMVLKDNWPEMHEALCDC